VGWGLGHVYLGDARGWLLLVLELLAAAGIFILAATLIDGTRWLVVFPPLVLFFVVWVGQALDAYRRALRAGGEPGGEMSLAAVLPVAMVVFTVFWLVGGRHGSPSATLQSYIEAWTSARPEAGARLFRVAPDAAALSAEWAAARDEMVERIATARALYGAESGLDAARPFSSLRFREVEQAGGQATMVVEIVRSERVQTTLLGIVPTAAQETVVVEPALTIDLALERAATPPWLPFAGIESYVWKISSVEAPASP
jgi:hypothetical protein